jgi:hypothetical protein
VLALGEDPSRPNPKKTGSLLGKIDFKAMLSKKGKPRPRPTHMRN